MYRGYQCVYRIIETTEKDFDVVNYHTLKSQHRDDDIMKILNYIEQKEKEIKNNAK